mmetsp:Transcript_10464/g.28359  ORF Transcript_10464/g.28359 Transcript_10464/m.28359 type:complete len:191 (+) Transcript_10464:15-587(+)
MSTVARFLRRGPNAPPASASIFETLALDAGSRVQGALEHSDAARRAPMHLQSFALGLALLPEGPPTAKHFAAPGHISPQTVAGVGRPTLLAAAPARCAHVARNGLLLEVPASACLFDALALDCGSTSRQRLQQAKRRARRSRDLGVKPPAWGAALLLRCDGRDAAAKAESTCSSATPHTTSSSLPEFLEA